MATSLRTFYVPALCAGLLLACGGANEDGPGQEPPIALEPPPGIIPSDGNPHGEPEEPEEPEEPKTPPGHDGFGCPSIYAQDKLPTFEVEISSDEWAKLEYEFHNRQEAKDAGRDDNPYHPIVFRYGTSEFPNAMIRLKGQSSWDLAVANDPNPKMQFVISFNEVHKEGRFHGLRKLVLDMPRNDRTFVRQRLALSALRDLGQRVQCANNAKLVINGTYYGLYVNLEHLDKEFIQRNFPQHDDGDLWKGGYDLKTNEESGQWDRRSQFQNVQTPAEAAAFADLDEMVAMWAADAVLPNSDGYFAGTYNFYLYDHPEQGYLWLPYDLDGAFDFAPHEAHPVDWKYAPTKQHHFQVLLADPGWRARYVQALEQATGRYDPAKLEERLERWTAQIARAADEDPHRPFSMAEHDYAVKRLSEFFGERKLYLHQWLACVQSSGDPASCP